MVDVQSEFCSRPQHFALRCLYKVSEFRGMGTFSLIRSRRVTTSEPSHSGHLTIDGGGSHTLPREWHDLVHDHASDKLAFNRRQLEVVVMLELATAIKAGGYLSADR